MRFRLIPSRWRFLRRLNLKRRLQGRSEPGPPAPFVVGATRSGTTLLRLMLDAHPEVAIPSETHFIPKLIRTCERWRVTPDMLADVVIEHKRWGDFHLDADELRARYREIEPLNMSDAVRAFYAMYAEGQGKPRWGDKTPGYLRYMRRIEWVLPEARFIHLIRDGRDVALSVLPMNWGPTNLTEAAELWVERVSVAREQSRLVGHYMELKYEDLVTDPEALGPGDARLPRARGGAAAREGSGPPAKGGRAPASARRGEDGQPRDGKGAPEPQPDREVANGDESRRPRPLRGGGG
jgi:Sulfotransferase family